MGSAIICFIMAALALTMGIAAAEGGFAIASLIYGIFAGVHLTFALSDGFKAAAARARRNAGGRA